MNIDFNFIVLRRFLAFLFMLGYNDIITLSSDAFDKFKKDIKDLSRERMYLNSTYYCGLDKLYGMKSFSYSTTHKELNHGKMIRVLCHPFLAPIYLETEQYCEQIRNVWEKNKDTVKKILTDLLHLDSVNIPKVDVVVLHPSINIIEASETKIYLGGCLLQDPHRTFFNIEITALIHEYLHHLLVSPGEYYEGGNLEGKAIRKFEIIHAIVELIANEELPKRLQEMYNIEGQFPFYYGHNSLKPFRDAIRPLFKEYITHPEISIHQFIDAIFNNDDLKNSIYEEINKHPKQKSLSANNITSSLNN